MANRRFQVPCKVHGPSLVKVDVDRIIIEVVIAKGFLNFLVS